MDAELFSVFPELSSAHRMLCEESVDENPGMYILYENVFARYIDRLLAARPSPVRDRKLREIFNFIERMLADGGEVENLAFVAILEDRSYGWLRVATPFLGDRSKAALDEYHPGWRDQTRAHASDYQGEMPDRYGIDQIVDRALNRHDATTSG